MLSRRMLRATRTMRASSAAWWRMSSASSIMASVFPVFLVDAFVQRLALHAVVGFLGEAGGELVRGAGHFVAQLEVVGEAVRIERARLDRPAHGASRFLRMAAIAEAALVGERFDVAEILGDVFFAGRLEFA